MLAMASLPFLTSLTSHLTGEVDAILMAAEKGQPIPVFTLQKAPTGPVTSPKFLKLKDPASWNLKHQKPHSQGSWEVIPMNLWTGERQRCFQEWQLHGGWWRVMQVFLVFDKEPGKTHKPLPPNHDCLILFEGWGRVSPKLRGHFCLRSCIKRRSSARCWESSGAQQCSAGRFEGLRSKLGDQLTVTMRWDERPVVVEEPLQFENSELHTGT